MTPLTRPRTRGECASVPRPCVFASCRHNLTVDVNSRGQVRKLPIVDASKSCVLDIADRAEPMSLGEIAEMVGLTAEGVRVIERDALEKLTKRARNAGLEMIDRRDPE